MSFEITKKDPKGTVSNTDLTARDITYVDGSFTLSNVNLAADTAYSNLNARLAYISGAFALSYVNIAPADITLGNYLLSLRFSDAALAVDAVVVGISKQLFDTANVSDVYSLQSSKNLADVAATNDNANFETNKALQSTAAANDAIGPFEAGKNFNESLQWVDVLVKSSNTPRYDSFNVSDSPLLGISKLVVDSGAVTDSDVKSVIKSNNDLASITDAGSLFWQDYVDNPIYFAQDYVGDRQTF